MNIGFDVISDLYLTPESKFDWEGKATSLYCIVAGNISNDIKIIRQTLAHLSRYYQGVFYCLGSLEYEDCVDITKRTKELMKICNTVHNVAVLHQHVVIVENIAVVGANGWYGNTVPADQITELQIEVNRHEDIIYLSKSIEKLQRHLDVKHIIVVSNSVPKGDLYFGQMPEHVKNQLPIDLALNSDTEKKIRYWVYGTDEKVVDISMNYISYINNSCYSRQPYWAKRIEI
jgi:hypothetical protein